MARDVHLLFTNFENLVKRLYSLEASYFRCEAHKF